MFGSTITVGEAVRMEAVKCTVTVGGGTFSGALTAVQAQAQRPVQRVWDMSAGQMLLVSGIPEGNVSFGNIVTAFYEPGGDSVCTRASITVQAGNGKCPEPVDQSITFSDCVLVAVGFSLASEQLLMQQNAQYMFMDYTIG
jgi:hypothetical protein